MDFRPDGAWRRRTDQIRASRHRLLQARSFGALNATAPLGAANKVTGTFHVPVVPIAFKNAPPTVTAAELQDALFNPAPTIRPYSVKTYYEQLSNGNIAMDGQVFAWVTADTNDTYYEDNCNGVGVRNACVHPDRFGQLLLEALVKNDNGVRDWGQFDNDGPDGVPNSGDDDGVVDFVTFLQPEVDGACGGPHIWAHRYVISAWNGGSPYVTKSPRRDALGNPIPGQFITVDDYTMQSAVGGPSACTDMLVMPIGTVAHETGHAFGLPDLYDVSLQTEGIGEWGLMGSGNYARPYSPARYEAWSMTEMGWVTVDTLTSSRTVIAGPVTSSDTVFYFPAQNSTHEYFLVENRQALESDSAQMNGVWPRAKSPGLLIWHIDQNIIDAHGFRTGDNHVNTGSVQGVALLQADGLNQLRTPFLGNRGDQGDSYPGTAMNRKISATTNPAAMDNAGHIAGFSIDSIYQVSPNGPMVFRFLRRPPTLIAATDPLATVRVNGTQYNRFEDIVAPGITLALDADSIQNANQNRSQLRFLSWSNGGPKSQSIAAGTIPDTLIASFGVDHRLWVRGAGGGTFNAAPADTYATGAFVPAGSVVVLTVAPPPAGLVFAGWSGDTAAAGDTLTLTMTKPYDIYANFTTTVPVDLPNAVNEILTAGPGLNTTQKTFLDQIGNNNGGFDLGDFLAYLQLTGVTASPPVTGRVAATPAKAARPPAGRGKREASHP
jgi:M6 family metalloprotease-like protein